MATVRFAIKDDAEQILAIYSPCILATAISFETVVPSEDEMQSRIETCLQKYPWIICEIDGRIAAYVYASKHRDREAYQWSCECSVYVHDDFKGKEIGKALYHLLFNILMAQGFRNVYAGITLPNEASRKLHEKCGFQKFAEYENIGYKFGKWHTVGWWKLQINNYDLNPPPPIKISELNSVMLSELFQKASEAIQFSLIG
jgi:L-amino acid N-acyltransferase YncA